MSRQVCAAFFRTNRQLSQVQGHVLEPIQRQKLKINVIRPSPIQ